MARITIDARTLGIGGIGSYVSTLLTELCTLCPPHALYALVRNKQCFNWPEPCCITPVQLRSAVYSISEQLRVPLAVPRSSLLHVPHYNVPFLFYGPVVTTIHDLIHLQYPEYFRFAAMAFYSKTLILNAVRKARQIITVSNASKEALVQYAGAPDHKIHVIPNKVPQQLIDAASDRGILAELNLSPSTYFLYVGQIKPYKNITGLIEAFAEFSKRCPDIHLIIVAYHIKLQFDIQRLIEARKLSGRVSILSGLSFERMKCLYENAIALVLPSFSEGFGLPVLEAMTLGTPVIASNIAPIVEIASDAALLVNPRNPSEIAEAMWFLQSCSSQRRVMRERGLLRAYNFATIPVGSETMKVYESALA